MKTLTHPLRTLAALAVLSASFALPQSASAAKAFGSISSVPASTNITPGFATNLSATVTLVTGSGGSFYAGEATFVLSVSPAEPTVTASVSPTSVTFVNKSDSRPTTLSVSTTASTPPNIYVVTITGYSSAAGVTNSTATPISTTYTVSATPVPPSTPIKLWTPAGLTTNWSTAGNWSPSGAPVSTNDVQFFDPGATNAAGLVDNVVDASRTIRSLTYGQTNGFHTTLIQPGVTLTIGGTNALVVGTGTDTNETVLDTITGAGGTLALVNPAGSVFVSQSHAIDNGIANAQLDLSGLDTLTATVGRVLVGVDVSIKGASGVLRLAKTNTLALTTGSTAPQLDVGESSLSGGIAGTNSTLFLGQTNAIYVDSVAVGRGKNTGSGNHPYTASMLFNSAFSSPVAYFRGTGGSASRVATWSIGDGFNAKSLASLGLADFSSGTVDALVDTMYVGRGSTAASGSDGNGSLVLNGGTLDVNTLKVGTTEVGAGIGNVTVNGGTLVVNTGLELAHNGTASGTLNLFGGALIAKAGITMGGGNTHINLAGGILNATNNGTSVGSASAPVGFFTMTNGTLNVAVSGATPPVTVDTYFATGGATNTIGISSLPVLTNLPAQFTVIQFVPADITTAGDFNIGLGVLPPGGYDGYISNNLANFSVDVVITAGPVTPVLTWDGAASGDWDTVTANWKTNGVLTTYSQGYGLVQFDDSLSGTNTVNLTTNLTPGTVTVNNSLTNYTFAGAGKLSGSASVVKAGSATLTLDNSGTNDFTGGVTILAGTLQIGNGDTNGNLPAGAVSDNGTLSLDRADQVTVSNLISGLGGVSQIGAGTTTLSAANTFAGATVVSAGTLQVGNAAALGTVAGGTVVSNGGTLDVNGFTLGLEPVTVSGPGVAGSGALLNNGPNQSKVLRLVTLAGSTTFGGFGDWDISASANSASDASLTSPSSAYKLTKLGTNTFTLLGVVVDSNLGDIDVQSGTFSVERNTSGLGNPANTITVFTNATLQFVSASNALSKNLVLNDGAGLKSGSGANTFGGPVTLAGAGSISVSGVSLRLTNVIGGPGSLTKFQGGTLILSAANTYGGSTLVSTGTVALVGAGSISGSSNITVAAGGVLDATGRTDAALTLASGQTLGGNGTILGAVVASSGSTLAPGSSAGTLTISNALTLQAGSTTVMELNKAAGTNDQVRGLTSVTYGGTLTIVGLGGAYVPGDVFKLFSAATYVPSAFDNINLPAGVTWDTSGLSANGTIQVVSVARPQLTGITPIAGGAFQLGFTGPGGNNYRVWASTNVAATPITNTWTVIKSGLFDSTGVATFVDNNATNYPAQFYLISVP